MQPGPISAADVEHFREEGYLVRQEFSPVEATALQQMVSVLLAAPTFPNARITAHRALEEPDHTRFPSNPYATYHVVNTVLAGDEWLALMADDRLLDSVAKLIGPAIDLDMSFLRMRPPGLRMDAPWHRDADTDAFDDGRAVTVLIYPYAIRADSGSTRVIPATRGYSHQDLESQGVTIEELERASVAIEVPAGAVLYLSPTVVHRGDWNRTTDDSGVIAFEYRAEGNRRQSLASGEDLALTDLPVTRAGWRFKPAAVWMPQPPN